MAEGPVKTLVKEDICDSPAQLSRRQGRLTGVEGGSLVRPISETLFLALGNHWNQYHRFLKNCRKSPGRGVVHELRTTLRRFIATLDLIEELIDLRDVCRLRGSLKDQLDSLRDLRDLQVQEKTLKRDPKGVKLRDFLAFIQEVREREEKSVKRCLRKVSPRKLGTELLRIEEALGSASHGLKREQSASQTSIRILVKEFRTLKSCAHQAAPSDPAALHPIRIQFKKFRYTWEIVDPSFPIPAKAHKKMKVLQTLLGEIQDTV